MRNLLFLAHRIPYPPDKGEKIRSFNMLRHLTRSFRVHLGCLVDDPADARHVAALEDVCASVGAFPIDRRVQKLKALARLRPGRPLMPEFYRSPALLGWTERTLAAGAIDAVFLSTVVMAQYLPPRGGLPRVLDLIDIDSEKWAMYARRTGWPMRLVWAREARTLLAFECTAVAGSDVAFFVTAQEAARFGEIAPDAAGKVTWIENGVDLERFAPGLDLPSPYQGAGPHVVFTGHMDYWPNADAVSWFAAEVLPLVRGRFPEARFHVVGANPGPEVLRLRDVAGVAVTGRVPDVRPYVAHATVSVTPLRMARGVQNKVLEAMALGRPVVASPQAFEGVRVEAGRDLLVADGAEETAAAVIAVAEGRHPGLGAAARRVMEERYAWAATLAPLDRCMAGLVGGARDAASKPQVSCPAPELPAEITE